MDPAVKDFLQQNDGFALIAHISPDGDTLGSSLALCEALETMGKTVQPVCTAEVPEAYRFCPGAEKFVLPVAAKPARFVIAVDCGDLGRLGDAASLFEQAEKTLVIDHHGTNPGYGDVNWVEECGATAELIYLLLAEMDIPVTKTIAEDLYVGIASDTGNFAYSNTTERSFRIAGELLRSGYDMARVNRDLFRTQPVRKLRLQSELVRASKMSCDGKLIIGCLTNAMMDCCGATGADAEGLIDDLRDIDTVEVAIVLREEETDIVRVSLRGKNFFDVAAIAKMFGGGGHKLAAGCTFTGTPIEEAAERLRAAVAQTLR